MSKYERLPCLAASTKHGGFRRHGAATGQQASVAEVAGHRLGTSASTSSGSGGIVDKCQRKATTADQATRDHLQPYSSDGGGDSVFRTPPAAGYCLNGRRGDLASGSIGVEVGGRQILPPPTSILMG
uniref:Uncharacterized protein n=1 Tax=Oryza meridionalis TaxID=40149 RepID=A0A0E0DBZ5_9ORYZ